MKKTSKIIAAIFIAILATSMLLLACKGKAVKGEVASKVEGVVTIAIPGTIATLDTHNTMTTRDQSLARFICQGLFRFDENMNIVPELADSYSISENGLEYTIKLKTNIEFSDGNAFNAAVVKGNFDRLMTQDIMGTPLVEMVDKVEILNDLTLKITLKNVFNAFINLLTQSEIAMISPALLDKSTEEISANPIGTGPFLFKELVRSDHLKLVRNEKFQGPKGNVETLVVRSVSEDSSRVTMLTSGQAQFIISMNMPAELKDLIKKNDQIEIKNRASIIARYFTINMNAKVFQDIRVRQALNYAVDRDSLIKVVYGGYAVPLESLVPLDIPYAVKAVEPFRYNLEKAKQLLSEAGYPDGFRVEIFSINASRSLKESEFLQQQLAAVGIQATIVPRDGASHYAKGREYAKAHNSDPVLFQAGWSSSTGLIDWEIRSLLGSGKALNFGDFSSKEADVAIQEGLLIKGLFVNSRNQQLAKHYAKLQRSLYESVPWIYLVTSEIVWAQDKKLSGLSVRPDGGIIIDTLNYND